MAKKRDPRKKILTHLLKAVSHLVQLPQTHMRLDYDEEADVLYLHFDDRRGSTHSQMRDDGVILDYKGRRLVGVTILEASQRKRHQIYGSRCVDDLGWSRDSNERL